MEKGLPHSATITVRRPAAHVYDLVAHRAVPAKATGGTLKIDASFGPGDGRLFLITPAPVTSVRVAPPGQARLGGSVTIRTAVLDNRGKPLAAVIPVQVEVIDPQGGPRSRAATTRPGMASSASRSTWRAMIAPAAGR